MLPRLFLPFALRDFTFLGAFAKRFASCVCFDLCFFSAFPFSRLSFRGCFRLLYPLFIPLVLSRVLSLGNPWFIRSCFSLRLSGDLRFRLRFCLSNYRSSPVVVYFCLLRVFVLVRVSPVELSLRLPLRLPLEICLCFWLDFFCLLRRYFRSKFCFVPCLACCAFRSGLDVFLLVASLVFFSS